MSFSADENLLASGSDDETCRIWDVNSGQLLKTISGHNYSVISVSFSADGKLLASGSSDKTCRIWDVNSGQLLKTLSGHTNYVIQLVSVQMENCLHLEVVIKHAEFGM